MTKDMAQVIIDDVEKSGQLNGNLDISAEDTFKIAPILIKYGYAVILSHGDIGDDIKINWIYAGDVDQLEYADISNLCICTREVLDDYAEACNTIYLDENDEKED